MIRHSLIKSIQLLLYLIVLQTLHAENHIVVHDYEHVYTIHSLTDMDEEITKRFTILHLDALSQASLVIPYDQDKKVVEAEIQYSNASGLEIKKIKFKDFLDYATSDGFSIFTENRAKKVT